MVDNFDANLQRLGEERRRLEEQRDSINYQIAVARAMEEVGFENLDLSDSLFKETQTQARELVQKGLNEHVAIKLAAVQAGFFIAYRKGFTVENLIELITPELKDAIKVLLKNPSLRTEEDISTVIKRIILLMKEDSGEMFFVPALMQAVAEREKYAIDSRDIYVGGDSMVHISNPNDTTGARKNEKGPPPTA